MTRRGECYIIAKPDIASQEELGGFATMMYILAERHAVDIKTRVDGLTAKLRHKGYCASGVE